MNFGFSEDQELIRNSAHDFVDRESSFERLRELFDDPRGYSPDLWKKIADAGWLGAVYPEEYGGVGLGYVDLICILEEFGKGLMPEPLVTSSLLAGGAILEGGSQSQKETLLTALADGSKMFTMGAYEMKGRYDLAHVETSAQAAGDGFTLNGEKGFVAFAATADGILVTARSSGDTRGDDGITLFLIDPKASGVTLKSVSTMDRIPRATVVLKNVSVDGGAVIGTVGGALPIVENAVDRAIVGQCAEAVGAMDQALKITVAYAQERVQFGKPIGSFQAVKHKCANMYVDLEIARSSMYYAAMATDQNMPDLRAAVSSAKTLCSEGYVRIGKEAIQLHGGIGFTHEHNIHMFYKLAMVANVTFGDPAYHRERYAKENGYGKGAPEGASRQAAVAL